MASTAAAPPLLSGDGLKYSEPLIVGADGRVHSAVLPTQSESSVFALIDTTLVIDVIDAVIDRLKSDDEVAFAGFEDAGDEWGSEWESVSVTEQRAAAVNFRADTERLIAERDARALELDAAIAKALDEAANGVMRLLRSDGDDLKAAVRDALEQLGFTVSDRDVDRPADAEGDVHDLEVTDPDQPGWVAVCEVKGSTKGAKPVWLTMAERHAANYARSHDDQHPDAVWVVANANLNEPPDGRDILYADKPEELAYFADGNHGLVIDTRDLFQLVEHDTIDRATVRAALREATRRYER